MLSQTAPISSSSFSLFEEVFSSLSECKINQSCNKGAKKDTRFFIEEKETHIIFSLNVIHSMLLQSEEINKKN